MVLTPEQLKKEQDIRDLLPVNQRTATEFIHKFEPIFEPIKTALRYSHFAVGNFPAAFYEVPGLAKSRAGYGTRRYSFTQEVKTGHGNTYVHEVSQVFGVCWEIRTENGDEVGKVFLLPTQSEKQAFAGVEFLVAIDGQEPQSLTMTELSSASIAAMSEQLRVTLDQMLPE